MAKWPLCAGLISATIDEICRSYGRPQEGMFVINSA